MSSKASTPNSKKKLWFAATLIIRMRVEDEPGPYTCDEQIHLIHARSAEKAYKKAYKLGKAQETCHLNDAGQMVYRDFVGLQDLSQIEGKLADGTEIRSRLFGHRAPQKLVHTQDELRIFGKPLGDTWQARDEALPISQNGTGA